MLFEGRCCISIIFLIEIIDILGKPENEIGREGIEPRTAEIHFQQCLYLGSNSVGLEGAFLLKGSIELSNYSLLWDSGRSLASAVTC